jgi:pyruvate,orthophosphate dikinase
MKHRKARVGSSCLPYQQKDFEGIFKASRMVYPACIRLLDPPLHEFLPQHDDKKGQEEVATATRNYRGGSCNAWLKNSMSSTRCSVSVVAVWASAVQKSLRCKLVQSSKLLLTVLKAGIKVKPEVMVPLVGFKKELDLQVEIVHRVADGSA